MRESIAFASNEPGVTHVHDACVVDGVAQLAAHEQGLARLKWPTGSAVESTALAANAKLVARVDTGVVVVTDDALVHVVNGVAGPSTAIGYARSLTAGEGWVAVAEDKGVTLFLPGPNQSLHGVAKLSLPSESMNLTSIAGSGSWLGLSTYDGLSFVDCSNPREPRVRHVAGRLGRKGFTTIKAVGSQWLARDRGQLWLLEVGESLRVKRAVSFDESIGEHQDPLPTCIDGNWLWLGFGPRIGAWHVETGAVRVLEFKKPSFATGDLRLLEVKATSLTALSKNGERLEATISAEKPAPVMPQAFAEAVTAWVAHQLEQSSFETQTLGALELGVYERRVIVGLFPMASLPAYLTLARPPEVAEVKPSTLVSAEHLAEASPHLNDPVSWAALSTHIARLVEKTPQFQRLASGKTLIIHHTDGHQVKVWLEHRDTSKAFVPARAEGEYRGRKQSPLEVMQQSPWNERARVLKRAQTDEAWRNAVWALASQGQSFARRIAIELVAVDRPAAAEALLKAEGALSSSKGPEVALVRNVEEERLKAIDALREVREAPLVGARLKELANTDDPSISSRAILALGDPDDARLFTLAQREIERCLDADEAFDTEGWLANVLMAVGPRVITPLRTELERLYEATDDDDAQLVLLETLARSGVTKLPAGYDVEQRDARREENEERFGVPYDTPAPLLLVRTVATSALIANVETLTRRPDSRRPVWPRGFMPEPTHVSWLTFLTQAAPAVDKANALKPLIHLLIERIVPAQAFATDRRLALELALFLSARDIEVAQPLVTKVLEVDEPLFEASTDEAEAETDALGSDDADTLASLRIVLRRRSSLARGWRQLKAGDLVAARTTLTTLLADEPDGQVYFFEARLAWLETDDPTSAISAATKRLKKVSALDRPGRGRLLNLVGCAFDALNEPAKALPWFEKAVRQSEETGVFLANLAETFEKLGRLHEATDYARRAVRAGDMSELARRLSR